MDWKDLHEEHHFDKKAEPPIQTEDTTLMKYSLSFLEPFHPTILYYCHLKDNEACFYPNSRKDLQAVHVKQILQKTKE